MGLLTETESPAVGLELRRRGEKREDVTRWEWIAFMRRRVAEVESILLNKGLD